MSPNEKSEFRTWIENQVSDRELTVWSAAMDNLRQLHNDVWNGVKFFTTVNGILLAGLAAVASADSAAVVRGAIATACAIAGMCQTATARRILESHRRHYVEMLLRKTLIERELGFYDQKLAGRPLSFPWHIEEEHMSSLMREPDKWVDAQLERSTTISARLFAIYDTTIAVWVYIFFIGLIGTIRSW